VSSENPLTEREMEVARLVQEGKATADIASILDIKPSTVTTHIQTIKHKLGVDSNVEVAFWYREAVAA